MMTSWKDIKQFVQYDLWRRTTNELKGGKRAKRVGFGVLKTLILVVRGFNSKQLNTAANSLTYNLAFAIIPIMAMVLAIAKGFGFGEMIEQLLNRSMLGETNIVPEIMGMVYRYLDTAQGGTFIGIGLLILIWAVYSFFRNVEQSFNTIWDVKQSRSIIRQLTTYIAVLFLVPVLMIATSGVSLLIHTTIEDTALMGKVSEWHSSIVRLIQFIVAWGVFLWMYMAIPNTKVHFRSAIIPAVLMGTLFQLLQMLSMYIIVFLGRTSIVYGAFAAIPIIMMWLQWTCLLILIGAELSFAIQNNEQFEYEKDVEAMSRRYKDFLTLYLLHRIIQRFENDQEPYTAVEIAHENNIPIRLTLQLLNRLTDVGLLRTVYVEQKEDKTYQPALDTHKITFGMVTDRIDKQGTEAFLRGASPEMQAFWQRYVQLKDEHNTLKHIRIDELEL
ncbi:MAG: YihY/virulence factor BrkB family protein [Paludibacteraceae bacterium]|nr:YihY/virulence factor BrkB family protein [Paludibacteraceae bacterium]